MIPFVDLKGNVEKRVEIEPLQIKAIILRDLVKNLERSGASEAWLKDNKASFNAGAGGYLPLGSITNGDVIVEVDENNIRLVYEVSFAGLLIPAGLAVAFFTFGVSFLNMPLIFRVIPLGFGVFFYLAPIFQSLARLEMVLEEILKFACLEAEKQSS